MDSKSTMKMQDTDLSDANHEGFPYRMWHIPNVPGKPFFVVGDDVHQLRQLQNILGLYDLRLLNDGVRDDYANASGIEKWDYELREWEEVDDEGLL